MFVGYRWPSEQLFGSPSPFLAMPPTIVGLLLLVSALLVVPFPGLDTHPLSMGFVLTGVLLLGVLAAVFLLRSLVYFRDLYRATHYAVPDLVYLLTRLRSGAVGDLPVTVSFIAHSMGALVATMAARQLLETSSGRVLDVPGAGSKLRFGRLVMVSPDIPAEWIMPRRGVLESTLAAFEGVYLFSNAGDVVLKMVSAVGNFFSFPTRFWANGYRLGIMEVLNSHHFHHRRRSYFRRAVRLVHGHQRIRVGGRRRRQSAPFGARITSSRLAIDGRLGLLRLRRLIRQFHLGALLRQLRPRNFLRRRLRHQRRVRRLPRLRRLRLGWFTLAERLHPIPMRLWVWDVLAWAARLNRNTANELDAKDVHGGSAISRCSYFDCTEYFEWDGSGSRRKLLTPGKPVGELKAWHNWMLLLRYFIPKLRVDVHGGYFAGRTVPRLICKLAATSPKKLLLTEIAMAEAKGVRVSLADGALQAEAVDAGGDS